MQGEAADASLEVDVIEPTEEGPKEARKQGKRVESEDSCLRRGSGIGSAEPPQRILEDWVISVKIELGPEGMANGETSASQPGDVTGSHKPEPMPAPGSGAAGTA